MLSIVLSVHYILLTGGFSKVKTSFVDHSGTNCARASCIYWTLISSCQNFEDCNLKDGNEFIGDNLGGSHLVRLGDFGSYRPI